MGRPISAYSHQKPGTKGLELRGTFRRVRRLAAPLALLFVFLLAPFLSQVSAGKDLRMFYQQHCARCHGQDGSAVSAEGEKLSGQDFTDPDWQRSTGDDEMVQTILNGKFFGLAMPGFKDELTEQEAQQMVTEIIRKAEKGRMIAPDDSATGEK